MEQLKFDYATRDHTSFLELFKGNIPNLTPEWTDHSDSDMGIVILQLAAMGFDITAFAIDKATRENLLPHAKTRRGVLTLTRFLGYDIAWQEAATGTQRFAKLSSRLNTEVVIPARTRVTTNPDLGQPVVFETMNDLIIPAGQEFGEVTIAHGESFLEEEIGISSGQPNQRFTIEKLDVLKNTILIQTVEGEATYNWTLVDNFLNANASSRFFRIQMNEDGEVDIIFGNGRTGFIPPYGSEILSSCRTGGGTIGNIEANLINTVDRDIAGVQGTFNPTATSGGLEFEDLDLAREKAPRAKRSQGAIILPSDFEDRAMLVPGVRRAIANERFDASNTLDLYISTLEGTTFANVEPNVRAAVDNDETASFQTLHILPVVFKDYSLTLDVYTYDNIDSNTVLFELDNMLRDYLSPNNFNFGDTVYLSQIIQQCFKARGVRNVVIQSPLADVAAGNTELPRLTTLNINTIV